MTSDSSVIEDSFDDEQPTILKETVPALANGWASYGNYQLVGNGKVTNDMCGKYLSLKGCLRVDLHDHVGLDGVNYRGKVYVKIVHHWCNKPSCPVCFKSGWAIREARKVEARLAEASKRLGLAEHIVATVPSRHYGLPFGKLRALVTESLFARGIVGGVLLFHGFRYADHEEARTKNVPFGWRWSPHFHVLGFILGGYRCRGCPYLVVNKNNLWCSKEGACSGYEQRTRKARLKDGCIVKVLEKRKTIFGTAWYQLNHSSVDVTKKRFHVATWFGVCSYRKLKVTVEKKKELCPICSEELEKVHHTGALHIVKAKGTAGYIPSFIDDAVGADGSPNYCVARSGSYEEYARA